jgi:hypothetical protein
MTTSMARSVSLRPTSRISWRTRQNARYRNERVIAGCSPRIGPGVKVQFTAGAVEGAYEKAEALPASLEGANMRRIAA